MALSAIRRQADLVIIPSESAREDTVRYLGMERERIAVIPEGVEERFQPMGDHVRSGAVRRKYGIPSEYILSLGVLQPRKRILTLLQAFSFLIAEKVGQSFKLVIGGGSGWGLAELEGGLCA